MINLRCKIIPPYHTIPRETVWLMKSADGYWRGIHLYISRETGQKAGRSYT